MTIRLLFLLPLLALPFAISAEPEKKESKPVDFDKEIAPVLATKCNHCHGATKKGGGLDTRTVASLMKGGASGPAFAPGNESKSLIIDLIRYKEMPPKKDKTPKFTAEELAKFKTWVNEQKAK
jgi:mono/diheme cytochrome c family protein